MANHAPLQIRIGPDRQGLIDLDTVITSFWEELPKLLLAGGIGWLVATRISNRWDLAKKRNEFDLTLTTEFYDAIGSFKAIGRQAQIWGTGPTGRITQAQWDAARDRLLQQAIDLESRIDAILAKVVLEDRADDDVSEAERRRRLHVAGLMRVTVRNLREGIQDNNLATPAFGTAAFYLSNRIVSDLGEILYTRALKASDRTPGANGHGADYLNLINYRTADLQDATACLAPAVRAFNIARNQARQTGRRANVHALLRDGEWGLIEMHDNRPVALNPPAATCAVSFAPRVVTDQDVADAAAQVFATFPTVRQFLVLADRTARVIVVDRAGSGRPLICLPTDELPRDLPFRLNMAGPVMAARLLAWTFDDATERALQDIARAPLWAAGGAANGPV